MLLLILGRIKRRAKTTHGIVKLVYNSELSPVSDDVNTFIVYVRENFKAHTLSQRVNLTAAKTDV